MTQLRHDDEHETEVPKYVFGGPPVWAGAFLMLAGLGALVVGGCFLIGVMMLVTYGFGDPAKRPAARSPDENALLVLLYVLAFTFLIAGVALLLVGGWGLVRILLGKVGTA